KPSADLIHQRIRKLPLLHFLEILDNLIFPPFCCIGRKRSKRQIDLPCLLPFAGNHQGVRIVRPDPVQLRSEIDCVAARPYSSRKILRKQSRPAKRSQGARDSLYSTLFAVCGETGCKKILLSYFEGIFFSAHRAHKLTDAPVRDLDLGLPLRLVERSS